jgi:hypothetical protein
LQHATCSSSSTKPAQTARAPRGGAPHTSSSLGDPPPHARCLAVRCTAFQHLASHVRRLVRIRVLILRTHRLSASGSRRLSVDTGEGAGERASAQECALTCVGDERAHQGDAMEGLAAAAGGSAMLGLKAVVPSQVVPVGGRVQVLPGTLHVLCCSLTCCCAFSGPKYAAASRSIKPSFAHVVCLHCIRTRELSYLMGAKR